MKGIFISYRRDDSQLTCDRIYDTLGAVYGRRFVFRDVDTIPGGVDFRTTIEESLSQASVCLVIIGPHWLTATDGQGRRRLDSPDDLVRMEVEVALRRKIPILPLLVQGAQFPAVRDLPPSMAALINHNGRQVRPDPDFHRDMQAVLRDLSRYFAPTERANRLRGARYLIQRAFALAVTVISLALTALALATWIHIPFLSEWASRILGGH